MTFDEWWVRGVLTQTNPFNGDSSAFWAWEGWHAAHAAQAVAVPEAQAGVDRGKELEGK